MEGFEVLVAMVTVLAFVLLFFSFVAYQREGLPQLRIILAITGLFFAKGLILTVWIFADQSGDLSDVLVISLFIDLVVLLLLFVGGFRGAGKKRQEHEGRQREKEHRSPKKSAARK